EIAGIRLVPGDPRGDHAVERPEQPEHQLARLAHGAALGRLAGDVVAETVAGDVVLQERARVAAHEHPHAAGGRDREVVHVVEYAGDLLAAEPMPRAELREHLALALRVVADRMEVLALHERAR